MRKRRFDEGGSIEDESDRGTVTPEQKQAGRDSNSFGDAFKSARESGEKTFTWKGKSYGTDLAKGKSSSSDDKEDPEMVRKAYQTAGEMRKPKESESDRQRKLADEPGLESVSPELDVMPGGRGLKALAAGAKALAGSQIKKAAAKEAEAAVAKTADRASKIAAGKQAARKSRAEASGAMPGESSSGDFRWGFKKGGMTSKGYKSGGTVSKASSRGDGIAQRGKTRGKMC